MLIINTLKKISNLKISYFSAFFEKFHMTISVCRIRYHNFLATIQVNGDKIQ